MAASAALAELEAVLSEGTNRFHAFERFKELTLELGDGPVQEMVAFPR